LDLEHLRPPVRDEWRSQQFYSVDFGFDLAIGDAMALSSSVSLAPDVTIRPDEDVQSWTIAGQVG
jgi:hypothetical protein